MSTLPDFVMSLVTAHLTPLLQWFSDYVYADLLKRTPDHLLVKLHKRLNLAPVETACAAFHHTEGPGTKPTHTVPHMVRALLVGRFASRIGRCANSNGRSASIWSSNGGSAIRCLRRDRIIPPLNALNCGYAFTNIARCLTKSCVRLTTTFRASVSKLKSVTRTRCAPMPPKSHSSDSSVTRASACWPRWPKWTPRAKPRCGLNLTSRRFGARKTNSVSIT